MSRRIRNQPSQDSKAIIAEISLLDTGIWNCVFNCVAQNSMFHDRLQASNFLNNFLPHHFFVFLRSDSLAKQKQPLRKKNTNTRINWYFPGNSYYIPSQRYFWVDDDSPFPIGPFPFNGLLQLLPRPNFIRSTVPKYALVPVSPAKSHGSCVLWEMPCWI